MNKKIAITVNIIIGIIAEIILVYLGTKIQDFADIINEGQSGLSVAAGEILLSIILFLVLIIATCTNLSAQKINIGAIIGVNIVFGLISEILVYVVFDKFKPIITLGKIFQEEIGLSVLSSCFYFALCLIAVVIIINIVSVFFVTDNINVNVNTENYNNNNKYNETENKMSKECIYCHSENFVDSLYCENCGNKFPTEKICPFCNTKNGGTSKFCRKCGNILNSSILPENKETDNISVPAENDKVCPICNTINSGENKQCEKCGENLEDFSDSNCQKTQTNTTEELLENSEPEEENNGDKLLKL